MAALTSEIVPGLVAGGASCRMDADVAPKFGVGDKVRAININPIGHTRLPPARLRRTPLFETETLN